MGIDPLARLDGWRLRLATAALALLAGLAAALAHPPFGILPGLLGFALLLWLTDRNAGPRPLRGAFWYGWLAGFAYFGLGCWWVAEAFLVDPAQAWMAPFAASLLPAGLGLFWGAALVVYRRLRPAHVGRAVVFVGIFTLFEWLRGHILSGFPWNLPGEAWKAGGLVSQFASVAGAYGLTWLTLFIVCALVPLVQPGPRRPAAILAGAGAAVLAGLLAFGAVRLHGAVEAPTRTLVRVVQPDIPQEDKWTEAAFRSIVQKYLDLTAQAPRGATPSVVIWPEGALPAAANDLFAPGAWTRAAIARALRPGQVLLVGTYRVDGAPSGEVYYNSLLAFVRDGDDLKYLGVYDKHRLVPFGEFMPLDGLMEATGVKALTHVGDGFSHGPRPRPMQVPGVPLFQPLICYESLFPGLAEGNPRPAWIVNVSNDAWFGRTSGPLQHLNLASYRAIEQGLPIIRATPTGVSAVVDAYGRTAPGLSLRPGEHGVLDAPLPAALENTYFSKIGDLGVWALILASLLVVVPIRRPLPHVD
ncbi:MAG: apolipoprotein N-acyltransferase [Caulobacteraceae bacterium]|nr:apolipoprotein N-acyltransferase [Caulobacteraceae bacterium]